MFLIVHKHIFVLKPQWVVFRPSDKSLESFSIELQILICGLSNSEEGSRVLQILSLSLLIDYWFRIERVGHTIF